jgi:hypothetical protein
VGGGADVIQCQLGGQLHLSVSQLQRTQPAVQRIFGSNRLQRCAQAAFVMVAGCLLRDCTSTQ